MEAWPATVPAPDTKSSWQARCGLSDAKDTLHMVRDRSLPEHDASYTIDMTQTEYEAFAAWFLTDCNGGCECFTADWLDEAGFAHHFARFRGAGYTAERNGIRWTVKLEVEIIAMIYGSRFWQCYPTFMLEMEMPELDYETTVG